MRIRLPCLLSGLAKLLACLGLARRQQKTRVFAQHCTWICSGRVSSFSSAMQGNAKGMFCVNFLKALGHAFPDQLDQIPFAGTSNDTKKSGKNT